MSYYSPSIEIQPTKVEEKQENKTEEIKAIPVKKENTITEKKENKNTCPFILWRWILNIKNHCFLKK